MTSDLLRAAQAICARCSNREPLSQKYPGGYWHDPNYWCPASSIHKLIADAEGPARSEQ